MSTVTNEEATENIVELVAPSAEEALNTILPDILVPEDETLSSILKLVLDTVIKKIPEEEYRYGVPVIEMSTIWHVLELIIEVVESIKEKEKLNGSKAKELTMSAIKALIEDFAPPDTKEDMLNLLKQSIPAVIDLVFSASKGKLKINTASLMKLEHKEILDMDGDGDIDYNDLKLCQKLLKYLCCKK